MKQLFVIVLFSAFALISANASADSFRCGNSVIKVGDSVNLLMNKCGEPRRKYTTYEAINDHGRTYNSGVSNWVYARTGQKDMIVSVRSGVVVKTQVE